MNQIEIKRNYTWFDKPKLQPESKKKVGRVVRLGSDEIGIEAKGKIIKYKGNTINSCMGDISAGASNAVSRKVFGQHIFVSFKEI
jgi:hypothetical protein